MSKHCCGGPGPGHASASSPHPIRHSHEHNYRHGSGHSRNHGHSHGDADACCASELSITASASAGPVSDSRAEFGRLMASLALALAAEVLAYVAPESSVWTFTSMALAVLAVALAGIAILRQGLTSLFRADLNINALMAVAVIGAFLIGEWPEAAMVMALYALAELVEARSVDRARNAIRSLLELSPPMVQRRTAHGTWEEVAAERVAVGDVARVRPGERVPLDGHVTAGVSAIDESPVTGESMPVEKASGDPVFAGTINRHGGLEFEVTATAGDTVLARIIHSVEEAQSRRAPTQRFIDRFAKVYTPAVFVLAVIVALAGPVFFGLSWIDSLYRALVLLVIACPCALVISTPVTIVSGLAAAARRGILIKGGVYLEQARKLKRLALDKTGTLTEGRPRLVAHQWLRGALTENEISRIAASLAGLSDHPVSQAIAADLPAAAIKIEDFGANAGQGVYGKIDGQTYVLGNHRQVHDLGMCDSALEKSLHEHEVQGRTVSLLAGPQGVLAIFAVADTLRPTSGQAVAELSRLGVACVMLTGDNPVTAASVARQAGIVEVRAQLLPEEKLNALRAMANDGQLTGMVGDGINDAPALAAADIGFAMGAMGTDTAMEAADVVIMNDDLRRIPETIRLSRRTHSVLWQNIALALGIKAVFLSLAIFDHATMWMAVFADMGASLLVVFNGLRLLRPMAAQSGPPASRFPAWRRPVGH